MYHQFCSWQNQKVFPTSFSYDDPNHSFWEENPAHPVAYPLPWQLQSKNKRNKYMRHTENKLAWNKWYRPISRWIRSVCISITSILGTGLVMAFLQLDEAWIRKSFGVIQKFPPTGIFCFTPPFETIHLAGKYLRACLYPRIFIYAQQWTIQVWIDWNMLQFQTSITNVRHWIGDQQQEIIQRCPWRIR